MRGPRMPLHKHIKIQAYTLATHTLTQSAQNINKEKYDRNSISFTSPTLPNQFLPNTKPRALKTIAKRNAPGD